MNPANQTLAAVRKHFREHNLSVVGAIGFTLVLAAGLWLFVYGVCYWLLLFGRTLKEPFTSDFPVFWKPFCSIALSLVIIALIGRKLYPADSPPDHRTIKEHVFAIIMFLPRLTLMIWENLTAMVNLSNSEVKAAAQIMDELQYLEKLSLQQLAGRTKTTRSLNRVIFTLQVTQLVDLRTDKGQSWISVSAFAPPNFRKPILGRRKSTDDENVIDVPLPAIGDSTKALLPSSQKDHPIPPGFTG